MGKIMEAVFCVFYMIFVVILGIKIIRNAKDRKEIRWFGLMSLASGFVTREQLEINAARVIAMAKRMCKK